jgi:hypothetical protein
MESGVRQLTATDLNALTTTKQETFGTIGATADGRVFRYVGFGGTATIAPGLLCVSAALVANYQTLAITAVGTSGQVAANLLAGSTLLIVTNGATAVTQDQFAEGYLEVKQTSGTAQGPVLYKVRGNSAAAASGAITVVLDVKEPLRNTQTLVAGTDTVNLVANPFSAVAPSTTLNAAAGFTVAQVPNSATVTNYGWVQAAGPALVTNDAGGTLAVGTAFAQSVTTAGTVVAAGATSAEVGQTRVAINASTVAEAKVNVL